MSGLIVSRTYTGIPDFGVVPFSGAVLKTAVNEIVTEYFIVRIYESSKFILLYLTKNLFYSELISFTFSSQDDCVDKDELVQLEYYHRPVLLKGDAQPLEGCVIAISTYAGQERPFLQHLAETLGAVYCNF